MFEAKIVERRKRPETQRNETNSPFLIFRSMIFGWRMEPKIWADEVDVPRENIYMGDTIVNKSVFIEEADYCQKYLAPYILLTSSSHSLLAGRWHLHLFFTTAINHIGRISSALPAPSTSPSLLKEKFIYHPRYRQNKKIIKK